MDNSLRMNIEQRQQQTLAPLQLQFVRVLEMNENEVEEEVRRALDENPALEEKMESDDNDKGTEEVYGETAEQMMAADYMSEEDIPFYRYEANNRSASEPVYEPVAVEHGASLMEYLMGQLAENSLLDEEDMNIARYIVGNIDDNGYMTRSLREIVNDLAIYTGLDVSEEQVRRVWDAVRALDPPGIGAMDLRDAMLLQLRRMAPTEDVEVATEIVSDYFDVFSLMHFDRLRSMMNISQEQLRGALDLIKTLNPKPGSAISGNDADDRLRHITPDFQVEPEGDRFIVTMLSRVPGLAIEESFRPDSPLALSQNAEANAFLKKKREEATTFIKVMEMRRDTLMKVMRAIVARQQDFFLTDDPATLRPMILKDIASDTGMDLSVISRATSGKYVATRQGVYPLRFFFTERHKENEDVSVRQVITVLREMIENENPAKPLTDEALTQRLKEQGYDIARRTVAKYREKLGIPVGRLRHKI